MSAMKRLIGGCVFVCSLMTTAFAQGVPAQIGTEREAVAAVAPLVTATATATRVRFVAPGTVVQLRLEVFNEAGQKIFDTELRGGNVLDWHLQNGAGDRLPPGSYASVLTIKSLSGRLSQRMGLVTMNDEEASIVATGGAQLSAAQQQTIGPVEGNSAFTILQNSEPQAITTVTHDGTEGQLARTRGALSFRLGDLFSGKDTEQMRLTEAGRVGIGTSDPQATLDVAGTIRAERVTIVKPAKPGSTDKSVSAASAQSVDEQPLASGSGSQNRVAKWTDNAGTLGDSTITELDGKVGIGTANPDSLLHLAGPAGVNAITLNTPGSQRFRFQTVPGVENWGALTLNANYNSGWLLDNPAVNGYFFKLDTRGGNVSGPNNGLWLYRVPAGANPHTDETPIFGVSSEAAFFAGNVGIGTTAPGAKLHIVGSNGATVVDGDAPDAPPVLQVIGGNGGSTTGQATGGDAGAGADVLIQAGNGGTSVTGRLSRSGSITLQPGLPGAKQYAGQLLLAPTAGNVSVGSPFPLAKLDVLGSARFHEQLTNTFVDFSGAMLQIISSSSDTMRVVKDFPGGRLASFGSAGEFQIDAPGVPGGRLMVKESGDVGIGTSAPTNRFSVVGNADFSGNVGIGTPAPTNPVSVVGNADFSGNVGIGITAPSYKLHIIDPSNVGIRVETSLAGGRVASFASNGDFQIDAPFIPGGRFAVMQGGNVGINTATPNAKLQVVGGDVAITTQSKGLILKAIDGPNCVRLTVNNAGQLGTTFVACP